MRMPRKLEPFELNVGWAIGLMSSMGFKIEEMKRVSFITPFADRQFNVIRGGIYYHGDTKLFYEYRFEIGIENIIDSSVPILTMYYQNCLSSLVKELPKIRQVEAATKRLLGEPESKNEIWESHLTCIGYKYETARKISGLKIIYDSP